MAEVVFSFCLRAGLISGRGEREEKNASARQQPSSLSFSVFALDSANPLFFSEITQELSTPSRFLLACVVVCNELQYSNAFVPGARRPLFARAPGRAHLALALCPLAQLQLRCVLMFFRCVLFPLLLSACFCLYLMHVAVTAAAVKAKAPTTHRRRGRKGKSVYRGVCVTREGKWRAVIYKERKQVRGKPQRTALPSYAVLALALSPCLAHFLPRRPFFVATCDL